MSLIPFYNYDYEYWHLYHKVTFDGEARKITINPDVTDINVQRDIYSAWKEWLKVRDNSKFAVALRTTGGDPIGGGDLTGAYFFLLNGWKLFANTKIIGDIDIEGNIFQDDESDVFGFTEGVQLMRNKVSSLTTQATANVEVTITGSGLTPEESAQLDNVESMGAYTTASLDNLTLVNNAQTASLEELLSLNREQTGSLNTLLTLNYQQTSSLDQLIVLSNQQTGSLEELMIINNQQTGSLETIELNTSLILAGSGSAGGLTAAQAEQLLTIYHIMGLDPAKPLIVSPVARSVDGEVSQSISKTGEVVTVTRIL